MEYIIVVCVLFALVILVYASVTKDAAWRVLFVLLAALAVRLAIHTLLMRSMGVGYGGDNLTYENAAIEIAEKWKQQNFHFVTSDLAHLKSVALPCNLFAVIIYLSDGRASLACTAVVALIACSLCMIIYRFAQLLGADERSAFRLLIITAFAPAFLVHTSDTFKDGFNAFLVVSCIALACSNMKRFDVRKLLLLVPLLWALWYVRPYMVFMCVPPLIISLLRSRGAVSMYVTSAFLAMSIFIVSALAGVEVDIFDTIQDQLKYGQSEQTIQALAGGGSGVTFEGEIPWSNLGLKLLYTLLSPFPWMDGSVFLQLGKIEALICYYLLYSATRGMRILWHCDRNMLLILLFFIVPSLIAYATTIANIGLIVRQRMPIVMVCSLLAAVAWSKASRDNHGAASYIPEKPSRSVSCDGKVTRGRDRSSRERCLTRKSNL
ncbi:hypothetical protein [Nonomuraea turcica]|uniref:hypothetical protein n=1 Tax=Nonomuraea sp. G32 TaxID=3067274 RepID=UPI00273B67A3|nr:hypothetical protein [Nonomuraea sp. G32]MDP4510650.1 hypothetical protein [Nonomuraea sp. G32]